MVAVERVEVEGKGAELLLLPAVSLANNEEESEEKASVAVISPAVAKMTSSAGLRTASRRFILREYSCANSGERFLNKSSSLPLVQSSRNEHVTSWLVVALLWLVGIQTATKKIPLCKHLVAALQHSDRGGATKDGESRRMRQVEMFIYKP